MLFEYALRLTQNARASGDPEAVRSDVLDELVSREAARDVYHIALCADVAIIDDYTTSRARHMKGFRTTTFEEIAGDVPDPTVMSDCQEILPRWVGRG